jgi:para-nitrobenzyl esterase
VNTLVATPLAKGLFHRAIGESGARFTIDRTLAQAEQIGSQFGQSLSAPTLAALRALPADKVIAANFSTSTTVDGWVLPQSVAQIFRSGKQNDVATLIGSNSDEGSIFTREGTTLESFRTEAQRDFGAEGDAYIKLYPIAGTDARRARAQAMRDQTFGWEMRTWARLQTQTGKSKVFMYYLSHVPPLPNAAWLGAQHGAEIPYAFNWPNGKHSTEVAWTPLDKSLAEQVSSYWVNFATTGDPNGRNLPAWRPYARQDEQLLEIGDTVRMTPIPHAPALDFLDRARAARAAAPSTGRQ